MKLWKQAGPDGVLPEFLVFGRDPSIPPEDDQPLHITLAAFFTTLLSSGVIPSAWLRARGHPLFKPGPMSDTADPLSYRIIAMAPVLFKVFEHVLHDRLTQWGNENDLLHPNQFGFRARMGTDHAISALDRVISGRKARGKATWVAFVDLKKAYPSVFLKGLWTALAMKGVGPTVLASLQAMYQGASTTIHVPGVPSDGSKVEYTKGVREGAVLSPFLFDIFIDDLLRSLEDASLGVSELGLWLGALAYADDIALLASTREELEAMLNLLDHWCKKWRMVLGEGPTKSAIVVFGESRGARARRLTRAVRTMHQDGSIHFNRTARSLRCGALFIHEVESYCYLGVDFRYDLDFTSQAAKAARSLHKLAGQAIVIGAASKFLKTKTAFALFNMFTTSSSYMMAVWGSKLDAATHNMNAPREAVLRILQSCRVNEKSVLTDILLIEAGILSGASLADLEALCLCERLTRAPMLNVATRLFAATDRAFSRTQANVQHPDIGQWDVARTPRRPGAPGPPTFSQIPPIGIRTSINWRCAQLLLALKLPHPTRWSPSSDYPGESWRSMAYRVILASQAHQALYERPVSPIGRYANARFIWAYEAPHPGGSWAIQYASNHRHVMRIRLQVLGLTSQCGLHVRTRWQDRVCQGSPKCLQSRPSDTLCHALCLCPGRLAPIMARDAMLFPLLFEAYQLSSPSQAHVPPSVSVGQWTALLLGAPLPPFHTLRGGLSSSPVPDTTLLLLRVWLRFMKVSDAFIRDHIPPAPPDHSA